MIVFHTDLDNTLIYSVRREIGLEKICVEIYQGMEVSFMTKRSYALLQQVKEHVLVVPTTTRTKEQYERISFRNELSPYALVCNGGMLLVNGESDPSWYEESLQLIADCDEVLAEAEKLLNEDPDVCFEVRNINKLFLFTKSEEPTRTITRITEAVDLAKVEVFSNGSKVYVVPKALSKGMAVERFRKRMASTVSIAAGDSRFDVPMLEEATIAIAPEALAKEEQLPESAVVIPKESQYAEGLLKYILEKVV